MARELAPLRKKVAGVFLDLGISSPQFDEAGRGFRSRTKSGFWRDAADSRSSLEDAGENPAFYEPDATCRLNANAAATILHSFLLEASPGDAWPYPSVGGHVRRQLVAEPLATEPGVDAVARPAEQCAAPAPRLFSKREPWPPSTS